MAHRITRRRRVFASLSTGSLLLVLGCASPKPAWELPAPPVREAAIVAEGALTTRTLANGLRVMLLEDRSLPMVSMGLVVRRGAAVEPLGKEGVGDLKKLRTSRTRRKRLFCTANTSAWGSGRPCPLRTHWC